MQDRYTGDVGDFGKYGLLRALCRGNDVEPLTLAVVWYFVTSCESNADGKHVGYLLRPRTEYRSCDEELFQTLRNLLTDGQGKLIEANRRIEFIEKSAVLPAGTIFYSKPLCLTAATAEERRDERRDWISEALNETAEAHIVFLDPDNGVECASASQTAPKSGPKYAFWDDEILQFAGRDRSLIVYHHLNHSKKHEDQVRSLHDEFAQRMPGFKTSGLIFKRGTSRAYLIAMSPKHQDLLSARISEFMASNWIKHKHFVKIV